MLTGAGGDDWSGGGAPVLDEADRLMAGDPSALTPRAVRFLAARAFERFAVREWTGPRGVRALWDAVKRARVSGGPYAEHAWPLWMILGIEIWYRAVFYGVKPPQA
jgi:hypothetical protein